MLLEGLPESEATWENYEKIMKTFPKSHLEDKVVLQSEGIVMIVNKKLKLKITRTPH